MKWLVAGLAVALSSSAFAQSEPAQPQPAQAAPTQPAAASATPLVAPTEAAPEIPFDSMPDFLKLPKDMYLGEAAGVAVNSKGHIFVFHRGNVTGAAYKAQAAQLLEFGPDGKYIREIGHNLYAWSFAHAVKVDRYDNIWAVDKGSDTIVRFNPAGRVTMVFGRKQEASDEGSEPYKREGVPWPTKFDDGRFRLPTDVAWDSKDNSYFSDGYWNSRVGKADKDGVWLKSWGSHGKGTGQFDTPHSIAVDAHDNVYVADRGNGRIQVFDTEGNFVRAISMQNVPLPPGSKPAIGNQPPSLQGYQGSMTQMQGAPWAICITPPPNQVLYMADAFPGRIYKMSLDGKLLGTFGKSGKLIKQFGWIHEMACPSENVLFVAEVLNWRVQKLILHPTAAESASAQ